MRRTAHTHRADRRSAPARMIALPPEGLYWAVLPAFTAGNSAARAAALRAAFEAFVPASIDGLEIRFARIRGAGGGGGEGGQVGEGGEDRFIACAADRAALAGWIAAAEGSAGADGWVDSAVPAALPPPVLARLGITAEDSRAAAARLEFRTGRFAGRRASRRRVAAMVAAAATLVAATGLLSVSMLRAAAGAREAAAGANRSSALLADQALGSSAPSALDPGARLGAELRRLRQTRDKDAAGRLAADRGETLIALLAGWPEEVPTSVDSLVIDQGSVTLSGLVRDAADAERLRLGLERFALGWGVQSFSANDQQDGSRFSLALKRTASHPAGEAPP